MPYLLFAADICRMPLLLNLYWAVDAAVLFIYLFIKLIAAVAFDYLFGDIILLASSGFWLCQVQVRLVVRSSVSCLPLVRSGQAGWPGQVVRSSGQAVQEAHRRSSGVRHPASGQGQVRPASCIVFFFFQLIPGHQVVRSSSSSGKPTNRPSRFAVTVNWSSSSSSVIRGRQEQLCPNRNQSSDRNLSFCLTDTDQTSSDRQLVCLIPSCHCPTPSRLTSEPSSNLASYQPTNQPLISSNHTLQICRAISICMQFVNSNSCSDINCCSSRYL